MNCATSSALAPATINTCPPTAADCSTSGGPRPCWPSCKPHDPDWPHPSSGDTCCASPDRTALMTRATTGEELESERLKARLGAALIERDGIMSCSCCGC